MSTRPSAARTRRSTTVVVDASAMVVLLADPGPGGEAVAERLHGCTLVAPELLFVEVAELLRTMRQRGELSDAEASMAFAELMELPIEPWPFEPIAQRVWALRHGFACADAVFLALAQLLDVPLVTRDARLALAADGFARARGLPMGRVEVVAVPRMPPGASSCPGS